MNQFFQKGMEMMRKIFQRILGVPADRAQAVAVTQRPVEGEFIPESELHSVIHAAAEDGKSYVPWRVDADGEQWYRKVNADSVPPTIQAFDAADDDDEIPADDGVQFDALTKLRRETAIMQARYQRGEISGDLFGNEEYPEEFGDN